MIKNLQETNYFLMLATGGMLIGFAPIFVKWSYLSPSAISFWRMLLAIPFLVAFNFIINRKILFKVKNKKTVFYTALASLAFTTDLSLWHFSMSITSVSNATIIVNSAPIFTFCEKSFVNYRSSAFFTDCQALIAMFAVKSSEKIKEHCHALHAKVSPTSNVHVLHPDSTIP